MEPVVSRQVPLKLMPILLELADIKDGKTVSSKKASIFYMN